MTPGVIFQFFQRGSRRKITPGVIQADLTGKFCVITGATSGIGRVTAFALAEMGANLFLVGRNESAGSAIARTLRNRSRGAAIEFIRTDLSHQDDVRALAEGIQCRCDRVDTLINNAGARINEYDESRDGVELTFATNHLGHFLLTSLLIEHLMKAPAGRVVTVTSGVHSHATWHDGWLLGRRNYDGAVAYAKSKLANLMFAYELARRLADTRVTSNAVNPGIVATNFERNNGLRTWLGFLVGHGLKRRLVSARTGAETLILLAASETVAGVTGKYFFRNREAESSPASHDSEAARGLWDLSVQLTGVTSDLTYTT